MFKGNIFSFGQDNRNQTAALYHILLKICKNNKPAEYENVKWIVDEANYLCAKCYSGILISYSWFTWIEDTDFLPNNFNDKWQFEYKMTKNNKIARNKKGPIIKKYLKDVDYTYYLSQADIMCLDMAILKWKIYGKILIKLDILIFSIKHWFIKRFKNDKKNSK